jgi:hypothetical protein
MGTLPGDWYITIPMKVHISDLSRINEAASSEIAALREKYPDDTRLAVFAMPTPMAGLTWFLSADRLQYLYGGIDIIKQDSYVDSATIFPTEKNGNHLHDWWLDEYPEYVAE